MRPKKKKKRDSLKGAGVFRRPGQNVEDLCKIGTSSRDVRGGEFSLGAGRGGARKKIFGAGRVGAGQG